MLNNYTKMENGVIYQSDKKITMNYDQDYIKSSYAEEAMKNISYLRYGYLAGYLANQGFDSVKGLSVLDVGYGFGHFLKVCSDAGMKSYGHEVNGHDISKFAAQGNIDWDYDVITFFDSLEHFEDITFVKHLKCKHLLISLPWCHYPSDEWFENWKHRKYGEHIWHFSKEALCNFLEESGFRVNIISSFEDSLRTPVDNLPNVLSVVAEKA
tara:strand:- start:574 stop:1206 length:633 start_codon:yes stop_codon:yes gene_type:complete